MTTPQYQKNMRIMKIYVNKNVHKSRRKAPLRS